MNTVNYAAVKFWQKMGVERVILSWELSLDAIAGIRQQCPDVELKVFFTVRCALRIRDVVYCWDISITAIQIKERVPILAAENTTRNLLKKMRRVIGFRLKIVTFYQWAILATPVVAVRNISVSRQHLFSGRKRAKRRIIASDGRRKTALTS